MLLLSVKLRQSLSFCSGINFQFVTNFSDSHAVVGKDNESRWAHLKQSEINLFIKYINRI